MDIIGQRLERRDVDNLGFIFEPTIEPLPHQTVDGGEKGRERLARSGRRGDQHMPAGLEGRPSLRLRWRGRSEAAVKPRGNGGMKQRLWHHGTGLGGEGDVRARRMGPRARGNVVRPILGLSRA